MGAAIERLFLPLQRKLMPELIDMRLPFAGVFHNLMLLKIRKSYPGQARKIAHTVWGMGQAMFTKVVVVFDEDAPDLRDDEALLRLLLARLDSSRDLEFVLGPAETLDHASRALHFGSKVSLDLTRSMPGEGERAPAVRAPPTRTAAIGADGVRAELLRLPGVPTAALLDALTVVAVEKVPRGARRPSNRSGASASAGARPPDRVLVVDADQPLDDPRACCCRPREHRARARREPRTAPGRLAAPPPRLERRRLGVDATRKNAADGFARLAHRAGLPRPPSTRSPTTGATSASRAMRARLGCGFAAGLLRARRAGRRADCWVALSCGCRAGALASRAWSRSSSGEAAGDPSAHSSPGQDAGAAA
jgi:3-polyprenyl-4-hydroxybenzoate decarboxylase